MRATKQTAILTKLGKELVKNRDKQRDDEKRSLDQRFQRIASGKSVTYKL